MPQARIKESKTSFSQDFDVELDLLNKELEKYQGELANLENRKPLPPLQAKQRELDLALAERLKVLTQITKVERSLPSVFESKYETKRVPEEDIAALQKARSEQLIQRDVIDKKISRLREELSILKRSSIKNELKSEQLKEVKTIDDAIAAQNRKVHGLSALMTLRKNFTTFWIELIKIVDNYEKNKPAFQSKSTRAFFQKLAVARICMPACRVYTHVAGWYKTEEKNTKFSFDVVNGLIQELIKQEDAKEDAHLLTELKQLLSNTPIDQHDFEISYKAFSTRNFYLKLQGQANSEAIVKKYMEVIPDFNLDVLENNAYNTAKTGIDILLSEKVHGSDNIKIETQFYKQAKVFMDILTPLKNMPGLDLKFQTTLLKKARDILDSPGDSKHHDDFRALLQFIPVDKSAIYRKLKAVGIAFLGLAVIVGAAFVPLFPAQVGIGAAGLGMLAYGITLFRRPTLKEAGEKVLAKAEKLII